MRNVLCDGAHCRRPDGEVRRLPTGGGAAIIVCYHCYNWEMWDRAAQNYGRPEHDQLEEPKWEELQVYIGT